MTTRLEVFEPSAEVEEIEEGEDGGVEEEGWAPVGREEIYKARREREEAVKLRRAREMEGKAWTYDGASEKWELIDDPLVGVKAGRTAGLGLGRKD